LEIQTEELGWTKEAVDFVSEKKVPDEILTIRKRSPLVEAESRLYNEKIILYKKLVRLSADKLSNYKGYSFIGINDITRFNITNLTQKMDNPFMSLYMASDSEKGYTEFFGEKVYAIHFVIRCESGKELYYRKFRLLLNREGIKEIIEMSNEGF